MDLASLGPVQIEGCAFGRCRGVAKHVEALQWEQGEDAEHHARSLQSRNPVGVA